MKLCILYSVAVLLNLVGFTAGVLLLPAEVATAVEGGVVRSLGSPWLMLCFPAAAALFGLSLFPARLMRKGAARTASSAAFVAAGCALVCVGWLFFGFAAQGKGAGETVAFPYAACSALPLSLLTAAGGFLWSECRGGAVFGTGLVAAGLLSAAASAVFACVPAAERLDWCAFCVLAGAAAVALAVSAVLVRMRAKRGAEAPAEGPAAEEPAESGPSDGE